MDPSHPNTALLAGGAPDTAPVIGGAPETMPHVHRLSPRPPRRPACATGLPTDGAPRRHSTTPACASPSTTPPYGHSTTSARRLSLASTRRPVRAASRRGPRRPPRATGLPTDGGPPRAHSTRRPRSPPWSPTLAGRPAQAPPPRPSISI
ncbi:uncharacterized protein [Miscanthus floridulus]|uniref:uncharacterized protein n=1 Tax=Miscanthus floridulus TaxID=154761 RepID=UPI00345B3EB7